MISDSDFVRQLLPELSVQYDKAKSYISDVPTQSLIEFRRLAYGLVTRLSNHKLSFNSTNLYERIEQLSQTRMIDVPTTRSLHRLRGYANKGAHPEKYHLSQIQLQALTQKAIKDWLFLLEHLHLKWLRKAAPKYQLISHDATGSRELCYRAVMEDDHYAQYLLGMSFKAKGFSFQQQINQKHSNKTKDEKCKLDKQNLAKSAYWFSVAAPFYDKALYEHGLALFHGYQGEKQLAEGIKIIEQAAKKAVTDAEALLGYFYLVGSEAIHMDIDKAHHYLTLAAEKEQTEAMSNLGVLYYQQGKLKKAHHFIAKAARSGFPNAQYHLALMLASGEGCHQDQSASEHWLAEAAEQGQMDAMLDCARHMLNNEQSLGDDLSQAETYLKLVIEQSNNVTAMLELSTALVDGSFKRIDVVGAATLLNYAKTFATSSELNIISHLKTSLLEQIKRVMALTKNENEIKTLKQAGQLLN